MPTYLERYRAGEYTQVWEELIALGEGIRQTTIYADACAVARETMQRARRNVEVLYQRLQDIGYRFECEQARVAPTPMDQLRDQLATDPSIGAVLGDLLGNVASVQEQMAQLRDASGRQAQPPATCAFTPPSADIVARLDAFEEAIGPLPLSVRAWCEIVGSVDLIGSHPGLASYQHETFDVRESIRQMLKQNPDMVDAYRDMNEAQLRARLEGLPFPLENLVGLHELVREEIASGRASAQADSKPAVWIGDPLYLILDVDIGRAHALLEDQREDPLPGMGSGEAGFLLDVAPDPFHKAGFSSDACSIVLPDASADAYLHGTDVYLIAYLRKSYLWGGFPGLERCADRDDELLAYLRAGMEPI
jgi:hypothetical protein